MPIHPIHSAPSNTTVPATVTVSSPKPAPSNTTAPPNTPVPAAVTLSSKNPVPDTSAAPASVTLSSKNPVPDTSAAPTKKSIPSAKINAAISNVIGLPLSSIISTLESGTDIARKKTADLQYLSLPHCRIYPCEMKLGDGVKNFYLNPVWGEQGGEPNLNTYLGLLAWHGVRILKGSARGLDVLFYPESSITENFSNNYGDTFVGSYLKSFGGEGLTDLNQMLGGGGSFNAGLDTFLGDLGTVGSLIGSGKDYLTNMVKGRSSPIMKNIGNAVDKALAGQRFDFPSVWKSSGFNANYSLNIKLFNPNPNDAAMTEKYVSGPLCALLCLGLPIGHGDSYSWPFIHIIEAPGFFASRAAAIQNITVTKGGDQNLHSARTGFVCAVDVRIDFVNLFEPMIAGDTESLMYRTNLNDYISNITSPLNLEGQALDYIAGLTPLLPPQTTASGGAGESTRTGPGVQAVADNTPKPDIPVSQE